MLSLFDIIYNDDNHEDIRPRYLGACTQLSCFATENPKVVEDVIGKINSYLYEPEKQVQGLMILQTVVNQCSAEVFTKNSVTWLTLISRILQKDGSTEKKRIALIIAKRILLHLVAFPEVRKQVIEMSQSLILSILKSSKELEKESMECLAECLKLLPGPCGVIKSQIEQHIWSHFNELHNGIKEDACTCFAFLPTCGGSGNQNATHIMNWQNQMSKVLSTLHIILNHVFEDTEVDGQSYSNCQNVYALPEVSDNTYSAPFKYSHFFDAISLCMVKMLSTEYCFKVKIPVEEILSLVYRVLAFNNRMMLSRPSTKMSALGAVLPSFYCAAVTILRSLILSCQKLLLPYSDSILKSLIRTLQQTADSTSSGINKPYSFLRSTVYDVLSILLYKIRIGSIMEQYAGIIVEQILIDIKPQRVVTKLQHSTSKGSKGKHRKRSSLHNINTGTVNIAKDAAANHMICKHALKSMKALLHTAGSLLKPAVYKELHSICIMLILEIQQNPLSSPIPYNMHCCRQELYSVLLACLLNPPTDQLLPIQTAVNIFSIGQKDPHIKVAEICTMALSVCSSIIHPQVSVIQRPYFAPRPETTSTYGIPPVPAKNATNYFDQSSISGHNEENGRTMLNFLSQDVSLRANGETNIQNTVIPPMVNADKQDDICYKEVQQSEEHHTDLNGFSILPTIRSPCRENGNTCERDSILCNTVVDASCIPPLPNNCDKVLHRENVIHSENVMHSENSLHSENVSLSVKCTKETDSFVEADCVERCNEVNDPVIERKRSFPDNELEEHCSVKKKAADIVLQVSEDQLGVSEILQEFVPTSPDNNS